EKSERDAGKRAVHIAIIEPRRLRACDGAVEALPAPAPDLRRRPRIRIELVRRARVFATGPPAHPRQAELQAVVAGVDLRGVREGGAVAARLVDVHRGD